MKRKKRRGRPKLKATKDLEKEQRAIAKAVRDTRKRAPMSDEERQETQTRLNSLAEWERHILQQYHAPPMKKELAYAAASIGDESLEGYEEIILKEYRQVLSKGQAARASGMAANQKETVERKKSFLSHHGELINKLVGRGFSTSQIAETIFRQNANTMGPSVRTIRRWISEYRTK
jgi:hypothetical protein